MSETLVERMARAMWVALENDTLTGTWDETHEDGGLKQRLTRMALAALEAFKAMKPTPKMEHAALVAYEMVAGIIPNTAERHCCLILEAYLDAAIAEAERKP
jgi:hypothetical protein